MREKEYRRNCYRDSSSVVPRELDCEGCANASRAWAEKFKLVAPPKARGSRRSFRSRSMIWPIATPLELPVSPPVHESRICHSAPEKRGPTLEIDMLRLRRNASIVKFATFLSDMPNSAPAAALSVMIGRSLLITTIASKELVSSLRNAFPLPRQSLAAFLWF